jgi:hypothetical protein
MLGVHVCLLLLWQLQVRKQLVVLGCMSLLSRGWLEGIGV